ncbi:hypothetical protein Y032_0184g1012 [Ancylostoma ceylanicum]|uniref:Uncharacterized protein n=1 Tax=Ancylostoma ceylanicum TaxID=53326 RepID=A0A016SR99_9BILA|nr:hypothetical protein Y032_0184g1012 [Ancylostoma ceylanicum]
MLIRVNRYRINVRVTTFQRAVADILEVSLTQVLLLSLTLSFDTAFPLLQRQSFQKLLQEDGVADGVTMAADGVAVDGVAADPEEFTQEALEEDSAETSDDGPAKNKYIRYCARLFQINCWAQDAKDF